MFIDEIHRFNKSQQILASRCGKRLGDSDRATTENPSFEVVALLTRSQVYILKPLSYEKLEELATIGGRSF